MRDRPPASNRTVILPAALLLAAVWTLDSCAGGSAYPSLASRPAERLVDKPNVAGTAAPQATRGPASADLSGRLEHLVELASHAHRDFVDQRPAAERLIHAAGAAPAGSEAWAQATQALSGAEAARSLTAQPLAEIDRIDVEDHVAHAAQDGPDANQTPRADASAIAQARATVAALLAEEDTALAALNGRLAR